MESNDYGFGERARTNRAFQVNLVLGIVSGACASTLLGLVVNPLLDLQVSLLLIAGGLSGLIAGLVYLGFYTSAHLQRHTQRIQACLDRKNLLGILKTLAEEESVDSNFREQVKARSTLIEGPVGLAGHSIKLFDELIDQAKADGVRDNELIRDFRSQLERCKAFLETLDGESIRSLHERMNNALKDNAFGLGSHFTADYDKKNARITVSRKHFRWLRPTLVEMTAVSYIGNRLDKPLEILVKYSPLLSEEEHQRFEQVVRNCLRALQNTDGFDSQGLSFDGPDSLDYWVLMKQRVIEPICSCVRTGIDSIYSESNDHVTEQHKDDDTSSGSQAGNGSAKPE